MGIDLECSCGKVRGSAGCSTKSQQILGRSRIASRIKPNQLYFIGGVSRSHVGSGERISQSCIGLNNSRSTGDISSVINSEKSEICA